MIPCLVCPTFLLSFTSTKNICSQTKRNKNSTSSLHCTIISIESPTTFYALLDMITVMPKESDSYDRKYRYPFAAFTALTTNSKFIINHIFISEGDSVKVRADTFEKILRFFEGKTELNVVLSGYVSEFLTKLMELNYSEVSRFLFGNPARTNILIQHLDDVSLTKQVLYPLLFRGERDSDLETSVLEKKLERENIEMVLRPLRLKLIKDIWQRCATSTDTEVVVNTMWLFREAVTATKDEKSKIFLHDSLYSKAIVGELFELMLNTDVC